MYPYGKPSWARALQVGGALLAAWLLWDSAIIYPVRILVTFLHEASHGLAALLSGGQVDSITVENNGSGVCWTRGGLRWLVLSAGYLGSMLWGSLILILACRTRFDRAVSVLLGLGLLALTLLYVRAPFAFASGLLIGGGLAAMGLWLDQKTNDLFLVFIGSASCLYALFDLRSLWRIGGALKTDATMFSAEVLPLPPGVWTAAWALLAVLCLAQALKIALRENIRG
ncbi:MAG TPA: M50 family metallopeptidase [Elusimicrobiales bacterium]|nr:M50 family metallopeptidase [Elusimicrobiales bacterium]